MTRRLPDSHPYMKDPLKGLASARAMTTTFLTSLTGALVVLGLFVLILPLQIAQPWLARSIAEGLVFAGSVAVFLLVLILLAHLYMTRPLRALARERGLDPVPARPAATRPSLAGQLMVVLVLAALLALALWSEHRFADQLANTGFQHQGWVSLLVNPYGYPIPAGVGILTTLLGVVLANSVRNWLSWWRR